MGRYVAGCQSEQQAKLLGNAKELAQALHELLWEMVTMADMINREDPGMMNAIAHHEFETDHVQACRKARKLLGLLGMWGPPQKVN